MTTKRAYNCLYIDDPKGYGAVKDPKDDLSGVTPLSAEIGRQFTWKNMPQSTVTEEHLTFNAVNPFIPASNGDEAVLTALVNNPAVNVNINDGMIFSEVAYVMGFNGMRMDITLTNITGTGSRDVLVGYRESGPTDTIMRQRVDITASSQKLKLTDESFLKYVNDNDGNEIRINVYLVEPDAGIPTAESPLKMEYIIGTHKENNQSELKLYFETGGFWLVGKRAYFNIWWEGGGDSLFGTWVNVELDHGRPMIDLSKVTVGADSYAQLMTKSLNLNFDVDFDGAKPPADLGDYSFVGEYDEGDISGRVKPKSGVTDNISRISSYEGETTTTFTLK